jgi:hypothetical protein
MSGLAGTSDAAHPTVAPAAPPVPVDPPVWLPPVPELVPPLPVEPPVSVELLLLLQPVEPTVARPRLTRPTNAIFLKSVMFSFSD